MTNIMQYRYAGLIYNDIADCLNGMALSFWVQGCPLHCKGCQNEHTWDFSGGQPIPEGFLDHLSKSINANGIHRQFSVLGGEPFARENVHLVSDVIYRVRRDHPHITIYIWTGYTVEELLERKDEDIDFILAASNILIDGPYQEDQRDVTLKLRGSKNQRILDSAQSWLQKRAVPYDLLKNNA